MKTLTLSLYLFCLQFKKNNENVDGLLTQKLSVWLRVGRIRIVFLYKFIHDITVSYPTLLLSLIFIIIDSCGCTLVTFEDTVFDGFKKNSVLEWFSLRKYFTKIIYFTEMFAVYSTFDVAYNILVTFCVIPKMSRLMTAFNIVLEGQFLIACHRFCHMKREHCIACWSITWK